MWGVSTNHKIVLVFWLMCSYEVRTIRVLHTPDLILRMVRPGALVVPCDYSIVANKVDDLLPVLKPLSHLDVTILVSPVRYGVILNDGTI